MRDIAALIATGLIVCSVSACSSGYQQAKLAAGALPGGDAQVAIDNHSIGLAHAVDCRADQTLTTASISDTGRSGPPASVVATIDGANSLVVQSVTISGIDGFTGSYWRDVQGNATAKMTHQTYEIDGSAIGYEAKAPHQRVTRDFSVRFAC